MGGMFSTDEEMRSTCTILAGKPEGLKPLTRARCRLQSNIKSALKE
jgi:hypothetical protein